MAPRTLRLGEFLPEPAPLGSGGATLVENVIPQSNSYIPFRNIQPVTDSVPDDVLGAIFTRSDAGVAQGFAGTEEAIYRLSGTGQSWSDVSRVAGYTTAAGERWRATRYGDQLLMTNFSDDIQSFTLTTSSDFANLGVDLPKARFMVAASAHLVLGYTQDATDGLRVARLWWSAANNAGSFPTPQSDAAIAGRSDFQDLQGEYGEMTGLATSLQTGTFSAWRERGIITAQEVADNFVFAIDEIEGGRGLTASDSLVVIGGEAYYQTDEGFYKFNGAQSAPIGNSKFDQFFYDRVSPEHVRNTKGVVDSIRKLIYWAYRSIDGGGLIDEILIYNWETGSAAVIRGLEIREWARVLRPGLTIDELPGTIDSLPGSFDDRIYAGSTIPQFGAFNAQDALGTFTGPTLPAKIGTEQNEMIDGVRSFVRHARPLVDGAPCTIKMFGRDRTEDPLRLLKSAATNVEGRALLKGKARYASFQIEIAEGVEWQHAQALQLDVEPDAERMPAAGLPSAVGNFFLLDENGVLLTDETGAQLEDPQ